MISTEIFAFGVTPVQTNAALRTWDVSVPSRRIMIPGCMMLNRELDHNLDRKIGVYDIIRFYFCGVVCVCAGVNKHCCNGSQIENGIVSSREFAWSVAKFFVRSAFYENKSSGLT